MSTLQQVYTFHCFLVPCSSHVIVTVLSHSVPQFGSTALMLASASGHSAVVQLLLSSGAQVDLQDVVRHNINYSRTLLKDTPELRTPWLMRTYC